MHWNKRAHFLALLVCVSIPAFCQDLVVTKRGDTLNCKITKVKNSVVYFTYQYNGEVKNSILPKSHLTAYRQGFFPKDSVLFNNRPQPMRVATQPVVSQRPKISLTGYYDLIVDKWNDSMVCKILEVKKDKVRFRFGSKGNPMSTEIPMTNINAYYRNFFEKPAKVAAPKDAFSSNSALERINAGKMNAAGYSQTRLSLNLGVGHRIASAPAQASESYREHIRGLRTGVVFGADISSFISDSFGLGVKFAFHQSSQNSPRVYTPGFSGSLSETIKTTFIGPVLQSRMVDDHRKDQIVFSYGLGYLKYNNKAQLSSTSMNLRGATVGLAFDLSYEIPLDQNFGNKVGFQIGILFGKINNMEISGSRSTQAASLDEPEGLSRIDFTVGLRFGN
jgi:hypothetical protein